MIEAKDIGALFAVMRATYGHLWPHNSAEDVQVWLRKLGGFNRADITAAAERMTKAHPNHPPTLGQFEAAVSGPAPQANTYLPPPKPMSGTMAVANRTMTFVLMGSGGVKKLTLRAMIDLKNALVADYEGKNDAGFPRELANQLTELMEGYESAN
jgi:hypothetical protein